MATTAATEEAKPEPTPLQKQEDAISLILNGGKCSIHEHPALTVIQKVILKYQLNLDDDVRHFGNNISDLKRAINKLAKELK